VTLTGLVRWDVYHTDQTALTSTAVYRGNPFLIEVGLAYGASSPTQKINLESLKELLAESDARSLRQFLLTTFDGLGSAGVERILSEARMGPRQTPAKLDEESIARLHAAMKNVNLSEGQVMQVLRYANRVPLQFQPAACAITQSVTSNNWRAYGLSQSRNQLPTGPITLMVHMASVWVPFTSESKEAIASYPEIIKELRLALQAVGRKLGMYLNQRKRVKQEGERREIFLRYLGEVARAVSSIKNYDERKTKSIYGQLVDLAKRKTAVADARFDDSGKKVKAAQDFGENVLIVDPEEVGGYPQHGQETKDIGGHGDTHRQGQENSHVHSRPCRYRHPICRAWTRALR